MAASEWATVGSAGAAAVAALASWAAVWQARRWQKEQREPLLNIQVAEALDTGTIRVRIENTGGGFAREVSIWVREGPQVCAMGIPPHGSLGPGKGVTLRMGFTVTVGHLAEAIVICRFGPRTLAWDAAGRHKRWRRNLWAFWSPKSNDEVISRFFPDRPPIDNLSMVGYTLEAAD